MQGNQPTPSRRTTVLLPLLLSVACILGILIGMTLTNGRPAVVLETIPEQSDNYTGEGKIEEMLRYIEARYVDSVDRTELIDEAIETILQQLDPHSSYISKEELRRVTEKLEGNFEGIGVEFMMVDDTVVVVNPIAGGPAELVGILAGDRIVEVEDSTIAGRGLKNSDIIDLFKGKKGTSVTISVKRGQSSKFLKFTLTRDEIPLESVDVSYMLSETTGYVRISRFTSTTDREFVDAIEDMIDEEGMEDLVIDLRQNPGGYLQKATNILSQIFQNNGALLVYTEGRAVNRSDYESTGRSFFFLDDIVVLIDEGSASASEILAGAIQDQDRGVIIGRRSFGKGLVQEQYRLNDGSALRLTVARYFTPSGRSIQKSYDDLENYNSDFQDRFESGELFAENKIPVDDSTRYYTSSGRIVYGGGGIIPDVFIPLDTSLMTASFIAIRDRIPRAVFRYFEKHDLPQKWTFDRFVTSYQVPTDLVQSFLQETEDIATSEEISVHRADINRYIKARIAMKLFGDDGYYAVIQQEDAMVQKALELLSKPSSITQSDLFKD